MYSNFKIFVNVNELNLAAGHLGYEMGYLPYFPNQKFREVLWNILLQPSFGLREQELHLVHQVFRKKVRTGRFIIMSSFLLTVYLIWCMVTRLLTLVYIHIPRRMAALGAFFCRRRGIDAGDGTAPMLSKSYGVALFIGEGDPQSRPQ